MPSMRLMSALRMRMIPPPLVNSTASPTSRHASTWIALPFCRWMTSARAAGTIATTATSPTAASPLAFTSRPSSGDAPRRLSEDDRFPVAPERLAVDVGDLPEGSVRLDRVDENGHEILPVPARVGDPAQLVRHLRLAARRLRGPHPLHLLTLECLVEPEVWDWRLVGPSVAVHADHHARAGVFL